MWQPCLCVLWRSWKYTSTHTCAYIDAWSSRLCLQIHQVHTHARVWGIDSARLYPTMLANTFLSTVLHAHTQSMMHTCVYTHAYTHTPILHTCYVWATCWWRRWMAACCVCCAWNGAVDGWFLMVSVCVRWFSNACNCACTCESPACVRRSKQQNAQVRTHACEEVIDSTQIQPFMLPNTLSSTVLHIHTQPTVYMCLHTCIHTLHTCQVSATCLQSTWVPVWRACCAFHSNRWCWYCITCTHIMVCNWKLSSFITSTHLIVSILHIISTETRWL